MAKVKLEVRYEVEIDEKDIAKLNEASRMLGQGYGDPGRLELVKRLLVDVGLNGLSEVVCGDYRYDRLM